MLQRRWENIAPFTWCLVENLKSRPCSVSRILYMLCALFGTPSNLHMPLELRLLWLDKWFIICRLKRSVSLSHQTRGRSQSHKFLVPTIILFLINTGPFKHRVNIWENLILSVTLRPSGGGCSIVWKSVVGGFAQHTLWLEVVPNFVFTHLWSDSLTESFLISQPNRVEETAVEELPTAHREIVFAFIFLIIETKLIVSRKPCIS